jgi:hypothetical protein
MKHHIYITIQTIYQYFVEAPLAVITTSSILGYDATSLAHLILGILLCRSSQTLSVWMGSVAEQLFFRSPEMLDLLFKSGLWLFRFPPDVTLGIQA